MVSADAKHHVYLPTMLQSAKVTGCQWGGNPSHHALKHFTCANLKRYRFTGYGIVARLDGSGFQVEDMTGGQGGTEGTEASVHTCESSLGQSALA